MRRIKKTNLLAKQYEVWAVETSLEYGKSRKYYKDVFVSLLYCQEGLCAYTEFRLWDEEQVKKAPDLFKNGSFAEGKRPEVPADIEHFDSKLKKVNGWAWDNLFAVFEPINRNVKRVREPEIRKTMQDHEYYILKPDREEYNPFELLDYDTREHVFTSNPQLDDKKVEIVENMIYALGINFDFIKRQRMEYFEEIVFPKLRRHEDVRVKQFPTAFQFCKRKE
jgi:hypothetical protein